MNVVRMCGTRVPGGVYATTPSSPKGQEVEKFLIDPPIYEIKLPGEGEPTPIIDAFGVSPIGVSLWRDKAGTFHLLDWVGSKSYPNVADWIEETRAMGVSRRVPVSLDYSLLGPRSKILMFHSRGHMRNADDYLLDEKGEDASWHLHGECPKKLEAHNPLSFDMCTRLYWQDVWGGDRQYDDKRWVIRELPCNEYNALAPPDDLEPDYLPAMFAAFPIVALEVIRSDDGRHADALEASGKANIPVALFNQ